MEPGKVEVRKNAVILSSNDPVKAHILDVKVGYKRLIFAQKLKK